MNNWAPNKILRVSEVLKTSTRPLRVETDQGPALLKYVGNPQGEDALCSELISAELLKRLSIDSPEHSVLFIDSFERSDLGVKVRAGHAFLTKWEKSAITFSGSQELLQRLSNPEAITQLLVFDTWIRNTDRFVTGPSSREENLDNLLFVPAGRKVKMLVIDHSHAFTETTFEDGFHENWWQVQGLCGTLPNFAAFIKDDVLHSTLDMLSAFSRDELEDVVGRVPLDWGLSAVSRDRVVTGLMERALGMCEWLPREMLNQPPLGFEFGRRQ